jgi:CRISPR-associated protein Cas2
MPRAVISYDIIDDNRRTKVAKILLDYGERVQYSVFEVVMVDKLAEIKDRITPIVNEKEDSVRYYTICKGCESKIEVSGVKADLQTGETDVIII